MTDSQLINTLIKKDLPLSQLSHAHTKLKDYRLLYNSWDSAVGMRDGKKEYISRFM